MPYLLSFAIFSQGSLQVREIKWKSQGNREDPWCSADIFWASIFIFSCDFLMEVISQSKLKSVGKVTLVRESQGN